MRYSLLESLSNDHHTSSYVDSLIHQDPVRSLSKRQILELYSEYLSEVNSLNEASYEDAAVDEGFGSWLKHKLGKLGSLEKGGKIFGRGKAMKAASGDYNTIKGTPEIAAAEAAVQSAGGAEASEFPNNKDKEAFVNMASAAVMAAVSKAREEYKGDAAKFEEAVGNIRAWLKYMSDYKLADVYKHFESKHSDMPLLSEADLTQLSRGKGEDTESVKGLKSRLLPKILAAVGAAGGIAALISTTFPDQVWRVVQQPDSVQEVAKQLSSTYQVRPGDGMIRNLQGFIQNTKIDGVSQNLSWRNPDDVHKFFQLFGGSGGEAAGIEKFAALTKDPTNAAKFIQDRLAAGASVDQWGFEGGWRGFDVTGTTPNSILYMSKAAVPGMVNTLMGIVRIAQVVRGGSALATAATTGLTMNPVGMVASATALAGAATAAAITAIRNKGLKSSRAKTLNDLLQALDTVSSEEGGGDTSGNAGEGGPRGGTVEKLSDRDFLKQMTDLLVAKAGPPNPARGRGGVATAPWDPAKANGLARKVKAALDSLKKKGIISRTTVEKEFVTFNAEIETEGGTSLKGPDKTAAINLCMSYIGAAGERESLRGGAPNKEPMRDKDTAGKNKLVGEILVAMQSLNGKDGKPKYPDMRVKRSEYETLITKILQLLVAKKALLKEARIFVGNPENSPYFKEIVDAVAATTTFSAKGANKAQAKPFVADVFRIIIKRAQLAESKSAGSEVILERWNKIAGLSVL